MHQHLNIIIFTPLRFQQCIMAFSSTLYKLLFINEILSLRLICAFILLVGVYFPARVSCLSLTSSGVMSEVKSASNSHVIRLVLFRGGAACLRVTILFSLPWLPCFDYLGYQSPTRLGSDNEARMYYVHGFDSRFIYCVISGRGFFSLSAMFREIFPHLD